MARNLAGESALFIYLRIVFTFMRIRTRHAEQLSFELMTLANEKQQRALDLLAKICYD